MRTVSHSFFVKLNKRLDSSLTDPFTQCSEAFKEDLDFMEGKAGKVKKQEKERGQCSPSCRLKKPQTPQLLFLRTTEDLQVEHSPITWTIFLFQ